MHACRSTLEDPTTLADRGQIDRSQVWTRLVHEYAQWPDLLALALRIDDHGAIPHDVTMRSLSLGLPVLVLLLARPFAGHGRQALLPLLLVAVAVGMGAGLLHPPLMQLLPPLGYSRFPFSDYRGVFAVGAVLLAAQAWEYLAVQTRWRAVCWACAALVLAAGIGWASTSAYPGQRWLEPGSLQRLGLAAVGALGLLGLTLCLPRDGRHWAAPFLLPAALVLTVTEWDRIHEGGRYLFSEDADTVAERPFHGFDEARRRVREVLKWPPQTRPARVLVPEARMEQVPWRGYYTGEFMSHDYSGPLKFTRHQRILDTVPLARFGLLPWRAVVDDGDAHPAPPDLLQMAPAPLRTTYYGSNEIHYQVDLARETHVVENEVHWKGWSALLPQGEIEASSTWGFRSWTLPAGRYQMVAVFRPPHRKVARAVFAAGAATWVAMLWFQWRTRRRDGAGSLL